jgi:quercetin 2,3-dioxygenase
MITLRRAQERHHDTTAQNQAWRTFDPENQTDPLAKGFGLLEFLDEHHVAPGMNVELHPDREAEVVTYVHDGALDYDDSADRSSVIHGGEFLWMIAQAGIRHREANASHSDWAHVFQIWLRLPEGEVKSGFEKRRFNVAARRNVLCVVASPDGDEGSLRLHSKATIFSALPSQGRHMIHELASGTSTWLHVVEGSVILVDAVLTTGDAAGVTGERAISLTATEHSEILLIDIGGSRAPFSITTDGDAHVESKGTGAVIALA